MKRILAMIIAVVMMATLFVGCNGEAGNKGGATALEPEAGATLKVWAPDAALDVFKTQCDAFIAQYPDAGITIEVVAQGEGDAATNLLNDPEAAADVFSFACDQLNRLNDAGVIMPVNTNLAADVTERNSEASIAAATLNDILLAYPETGDNGYYLVYDKSLVSDEDAQTLEGVFEACRKAGKKFIVDAGNGFYSCMFPFTGGLTIEGLEGEDNDIQKFNEYDEAEVVATLEAFAKLFHEYSDIFFATDPAKISAGLAEDPSTVAAGIDGSWNAATVSSILGENYGAAKLPTINVNGTDKQIISMHGYKLIGVNAMSKFPNAAQLLADYLSGEACQLERAEKISWGPSNTAAAANEVVTSNPAISAILEQSANSVAQVNIASTFWDPMGNLGNNLFKEDAKYDTETLTALLDKTIKNIRDE
ncbi:MAG: extracellular solute-binding protein [Ruminococcaceae bacterium]|nr:extracellular solute-binding protein [Oscillospiraceae bacterium]